jgi:hypothetical protein
MLNTRVWAKVVNITQYEGKRLLWNKSGNEMLAHQRHRIHKKEITNFSTKVTNFIKGG